MKNNEINEALKKVAVGYCVEEVTEEYNVEDGEIRLIKRKETRKDIPPDLKAVKMLLESEGSSVTAMTDEQLQTEKERLLALLKENEKS